MRAIVAERLPPRQIRSPQGEIALPLLDAMKERASAPVLRRDVASASGQATGPRPCHGGRRGGPAPQALTRGRPGPCRRGRAVQTDRQRAGGVPAHLRRAQARTGRGRLRGDLRMELVRRPAPPMPASPRTCPTRWPPWRSQLPGSRTTRSTPTPWPTYYGPTCWPRPGSPRQLPARPAAWSAPAPAWSACVHGGQVCQRPLRASRASRRWRARSGLLCRSQGRGRRTDRRPVGCARVHVGAAPRGAANVDNPTGR
jgi:hypothetical protein